MGKRQIVPAGPAPGRRSVLGRRKPAGRHRRGSRKPPMEGAEMAGRGGLSRSSAMGGRNWGVLYRALKADREGGLQAR